MVGAEWWRSALHGFPPDECCFPVVIDLGVKLIGERNVI
jgi:hypothetical protein